MGRFEEYDFNGKRAVVRVDFNVPLKEGEVTDDTRIRAAVPTISRILGQGGSCILMSHLGRPKGKDAQFSLSQVVRCLESLLGQSVRFVDDCIGDEVEQAASSLESGEVLLLENLRFYDEEKAGDPAFAKKLGSLGEVYVNDAFGTAHRAHASTAIIAEHVSVALPGTIMQKEVANLEKVLGSAENPFIAIVGGAKVSSKIQILENLVGKVDALVIGGGMAYTFFKAKGGEIGGSLVEDDFIERASALMDKAESNGTKIHLPIDSIMADAFDNDAQKRSGLSGEIASGWMGLDIGEEAIAEFKSVVSQAKTILWNGPMGVFEMESFSKGTIEIAQAVAKATDNGAYSLVGGGDSVAAINRFGLSDRVSYISTGGGAMLEYLEGKELPGIAAVMMSPLP